MRAFLRDMRDRHPFLLGAALFLAIALASLGGGLLLVHTTLLGGFDRFFYELLSRNPNSVLDVLVKPVNLNFLPFGATPSYLNVWVVLLLGYLAIFKRKDLGPATLSLVFAFVMSFVILYINTKFVFRPRPFTVFPNIVGPQLQAYLVHVTSWPSGHTRDTAILATITAFYLPRLKWPVFVFALFVAFSRVYIGAHYPSDVIGGLLLGWALGALAVFLSTSAVRVWRERRDAATPASSRTA